MAQLEKDIERKFVNHARRYGWEVVKLNIQGNTGWPDRMVLLPCGRVVFVEFKRPGEPPSSRQEYVHAKLHAMGFAVGIFMDPIDALTFVTAQVLRV